MFQPTLIPARLGLLALGLAVLLSGPPRAAASTIVVPDEAPTIQAALDANVDTVLVRPGSYSETPVTHRSVALLAAPDSPADMPALSGLIIDEGDLIRIQGLRFDAQVVISVNSCCSDVHFTACDLRAGVLDSSFDNKTNSVTFLRCSLGGLFQFQVRGTVRLDSCQVTGQVLADRRPADGNVLVVRTCSFQGNGTGIAIRFGDGSCAVTGSTIRGYHDGVLAGGAGSIAGNLIEDCAGYGILAGWDHTIIENNVVRRCGTGIRAGAERGGITLRGNTVSEGANNGIEVGPSEYVEVVGNVVWGRGGHGFRLSRYSELLRLRVTQNTSCTNGGSGFLLDDPLVGSPSQGMEWTRNIGYANVGYGLHWLSPNAATVTCNDWFANQAGNLYGQPPSGADFSVDPMFCDAVSGDFRLNSSSPLLADSATCGQIGALGVGCGATATLVQRFTAGRASDGVRVVWQVAAGATASEIWVERAEGADGQAWTRPVMERSTDGGSVVELDRSALPDHTYRYRLVAMDGGTLMVLDPGILVEGLARLSFALAQVGPSPGAGPLRIGFTLARAAVIRIDVFDLLGRRVATPAGGTWPAGTQVIAWDGLTHAGSTAPAGMYVIHYRYPGGTDKRPVVRMQ